MESEPIAATRTTLCPFCREEILFDAIKCKHCGSTIVRVEPRRKLPAPPPDDGAIWLALPSVCVGALAAVAPLYLAFFKSIGIRLGALPSLRLFAIAVTGLILGVMATRRYKSRRTMAKIGIALSCIGLLSSLIMAVT